MTETPGKLFARQDLDTYAFSREVDEATMLRGLVRLGRLQRLFREGRWSDLTEKNVEQSFVERVFGDVFGYRTLLGADDDDDHVEVIPQLYVPFAAGNGAYPDFVLGHFRADSRQLVVSAELKGPRANLDASQSGASYARRSAVEQAMLAATAASAIWCIVSNTHEVRLYKTPHLDAYESVDLLDVTSPDAFRRAFALLSRESLVGDSSVDGPLAALYRHQQQGESMLVAKQPGRVRLVQRVRPTTLNRQIPYTKVSAGLRAALQAVPRWMPAVHATRHPLLQTDQLVVDAEQSGMVSRLAANRSGLMVCSIAMPGSSSGPEAHTAIDPVDVLLQLASMTALAKTFLKQVVPGTGRATIEWAFEDLSGHVEVAHGCEWVRPERALLACQANVDSILCPEVNWPTAHSVGVDDLVAQLTEVIAELFFPFEGRDGSGQLCRVEPTREEVRETLASKDCLSVFGTYIDGNWTEPAPRTDD